MKKQLTFLEAAKVIGIDHTVVVEMVQHEWIMPSADQTLDEEDLARAQFILDLRVRFGANDESIPIILHLADQLYCVRAQLKSLNER